MSFPNSVPHWPGVEPDSPSAEEHGPKPKAESVAHPVLNGLREEIAHGNKRPEVLLGSIAVAAQALTDASAAALAVRQGGAVYCVGRSGEMAPALGAELSEQAGISGECLRTGRNQQCEDAETNSLVDREVCRELGVRSIAVVPVRSRLETTGILEVFSSEPRAFTAEHVKLLTALADLADAVQNNGNYAFESPQKAKGVAPTLELTEAGADASPVSRWRHWGIAGALCLIALLAAAGWRMWKTPKDQESHSLSDRSVAASTMPVAEAPSVVASAPHQDKPLPERFGSSGEGKAPQKRAVTQASLLEPDNGMIRRIPKDAPAPKVPASEDGTRPASVTGEAGTPAPPVVVVTSSVQMPEDLLAATTALPSLALRTSQGAAPAVVITKVMPTYSMRTYPARPTGTVILDATVDEKGQVKEVRVVKGNPELARASVAAVRQWRYRPAQLNGQPTRSQTSISIIFK